MDLATAQRLMTAADPKDLSALKRHGDDPAAAKAVAGQFAALLLQNVMQGSDGAALPMAGEGVGGNIVSGLFVNAISQATASGKQLGLADILFRSIEAKQQTAAAGNKDKGPPQATARGSAGDPRPRAAQAAPGLPLDRYWHSDGVRSPAAQPAAAGPSPLAGARAANPPAATAPRAAPSSNGASVPASGWTPSPANSDNAQPLPQTAQAQSFARELRPMLLEAGRQLGVSPRILLAHAALETGWGRAVVGNNLFGIKAGASWQGAQIRTLTHEVEDGERVSREAAFRAYPSLDASVQDYVALIGGNPRYQSLLGLGDDAAAYGRGLIAGGYATDTDYGRKLQAVADAAAAAFATTSASGRLSLFATQD